MTVENISRSISMKECCQSATDQLASDLDLHTVCKVGHIRFNVNPAKAENILFLK